MNPMARPIPKRDLHFDFSSIDLNSWHPAGPQTSHYFNVQSLLFPQGERFFIRSVRHFRDQIADPELQQQVAAFVSQEAMHGREHQAYNTALEKTGYRAGQADARLGRILAFTEKLLGPKGCLAMTVALEHVTAIAAEELLEDDRLLAGADAEMARLWRWHAIEETEHKAVAFDVYAQVAGKGFSAWARRCSIMLAVSAAMQLIRWIALFRVTLRGGSFWDAGGWARLLRILWISPGSFRRQIPRYWRFFAPGFHPWQTDNYHHVQRWESALAVGPTGSVTDGAGS
jgi:hypothetical protein